MSKLTDYILHNDHHIVVANKPCAVGVSPVRDGDQGFMQMMESYVKQNLFTVHRIDVPVSGVVVFAKTKKAAAHLGRQFKEKSVQKTYLAITREKPDVLKGQWTDLLAKHKRGNKSSIVEEEDDNTKVAKCSFEWVESLDHIHLWKLYPSTGRHHQLRVQMAAHICPIRGDQKYGDKRGNKDRSIDLHARQIRFQHPSTNAWVEYKADVPDRTPWKYFPSLQNQVSHEQ